MRPMGLSTGSLAYGDFRRALKILENKMTAAVELSALRERELAPLINELDSIDLSSFKYISVHAPSKFGEAHDEEIIPLLKRVTERGWPIVVHPDVIRDVSAWDSFGEFLLIENMDKRYPLGRTADELIKIFARLPKAGLCFDAGHCRQVDQTMNESYLVLKEFGKRL